jgi:hypothetical protein
MSRATEGFSARTAMVLDSMAFIRSSVYRVPASNRRWQERNTSAQQHRHDAHFDRKLGTCPSSRLYGKMMLEAWFLSANAFLQQLIDPSLQVMCDA